MPHLLKRYHCTLLPALLGLAAVCWLGGCRKQQDVEEVYFEFELPFRVWPATDTIRVGDTLLLTANYSDTLYEALRGQRIPMECFGIPMLMVTTELKIPDKNIAGQPGATNAFSFLFGPDNGEVTSADFANIRPVCRGGRYHFELRLVARRAGVFAFMLQDQKVGFLNLPERLAPSTPDLRRIPVVRFNRYIINEGRTHFAIFRQHATPSPVNPNWPREGNWPKMEEYGTYTFVVR
jgi:hypothetical protein